MRRIEPRPLVCVICGGRVTLSSVTSPHAEAPEMISVPPGGWIGFVSGDTAPEMIVCCSEPCVQTLLEE